MKEKELAGIFAAGCYHEHGVLDLKTQSVRLPGLKISSGSLEALKWLGVISMTIDHANRFFLSPDYSYKAYCIGRLAMPLFAFIFAYNLARPVRLQSGLFAKMFKRLIFFGILATPAYMSMKGMQHLWPLNIMFMLLGAAIFIWLFEKGGVINRLAASLVLLIGGMLVEYSWEGLIFCIISWFYCKKPSKWRLIPYLLAYLLLCHLNGNYWALLAWPLIILATKIDFNIPRIPYFFYIYYPSHLTIFYFLKRLMA